MKRLLVVILILSSIFISNIIDTRRSKKTKRIKQDASKYLDKHQENGTVSPNRDYRIKLRMIKGVVETFCFNLGLSISDTRKILRVPVKRIGNILHHIAQIRTGAKSPEDAQQILTLLNLDELSSPRRVKVEMKFKNKKAVLNAIRSVQRFISVRKS